MHIWETQLFEEVQEKGIFQDSKTFADAIPLKPLEEILTEWNDTELSLRDFVLQNFKLREDSSDIQIDSDSPTDHIQRLWRSLRREDDHDERGSRIELPEPYIVPGGRFDEIYYWDSYFTMLGLLADGHLDQVRDMVYNFAYLIDAYGFIPNGTRHYFMSRSQPPFFFLMVHLLEQNDDLTDGVDFLDQLATEHSYWVQYDTFGPSLSGHTVNSHDEIYLHRYWDHESLPRPESYKEDYELYQKTHDPSLYRNIRSACESGWDFSSRWCVRPFELSSIDTISILPVDLNALLYGLEKYLATLYDQKGQEKHARYYDMVAKDRRDDVITWMLSVDEDYFFDYDIRRNVQVKRYYASGIFPLYMKMVNEAQAEQIARRFMNELVVRGGVLTSQIHSGQQWDAPNGWAPLQWVAYQAMVNYGFYDRAEEIRSRWLGTVESYFDTHHKMVEKYNVLTNENAGGGEYPNQDGFGWTNGVYRAMKEDLEIPLSFLDGHI